MLHVMLLPMLNILYLYVSTWPGRDADPSPPSSAEVKNRVELLPLLSLRAFVACERVKPTYTYVSIFRIMCVQCAI